MYIYGGPPENIQDYTCTMGSLIEAHIFRSMNEDECDYNHTLLDI